MIALLAGSVVSTGLAQRTQESPVFKDYKSPDELPRLRHSDHLYQIWQTFLISRKANAGDVLAQHELGIRYFVGVGVEADSAKAAIWIRRAAEQGLKESRFNLAILTYNGWGTAWDPFESFRQLTYCAAHGMKDAQYFLSIFHVENLVVPMSLDSARVWARMAADAGHKPAKDLVSYIDKQLKLQRESEDAGADSSAGSAFPSTGAPVGGGQPVLPVFVDFEPDTSESEGLTTLLEHALEGAGPEMKQALGLSQMLEREEETDSATFAAVLKAADAGSPEALALLGRSYEKGMGVPVDRVLAALFYVRAIRMDSPRAPRLLWSLVRMDGFVEELKSRAEDGDPAATYAWAGMVALGFDGLLIQQGALIMPEQAFQFLRSGAGDGHIPSMIELGLCYYSGRWASVNTDTALTLWETAQNAGSREAEVRTVVSRVREASDGSLAEADIQLLRDAVTEGSVLAEVALAYCHETGTGVSESFAEAVRLYRAGYRRGSKDAYRALRRLHDRIRPEEDRFALVD
ncbi:MAG: sel1 repeat family protein [Bacteroidetes bacterium]|nr:sel1 repeat family protein [Bacteroidota bacterium]